MASKSGDKSFGRNPTLIAGREHPRPIERRVGFALLEEITGMSSLSVQPNLCRALQYSSYRNVKVYFEASYVSRVRLIVRQCFKH